MEHEPDRTDLVRGDASSPFESPEEPAEGRMTFLEHLDELRTRITHAVGALLVGFVIAFAFIERVNRFVMEPMAAIVPGRQLIFTEPGEAFILYIKVGALLGLLLASPYVMWQVWLFIAPGLYAKEKRFAIPFVISSSALFIGGAAFSHYVAFPMAWKFFSSFSNDYMTFMPRIEPLFSLYMKLMLASGLIFQMPMIIFVLARLGLVSAGFLAKNIKYAILIIFITAAVITPGGDMATQTLMAGPMICLYFVSIGVAWVFGKSKKRDLGGDAEP